MLEEDGRQRQLCIRGSLNTVAVCADKGTVRFGIAVKSVRAVSSGNFGNFPKLYQERKVPVYSSQTDIREFFFNSCIDCIRSRMFVTILNKLSDTFPLSAVF